MKFLTLFLILLFFSCSKKNLNISEFPELKQIYNKVLITELEKNDSLALWDQSSNNTYFDFNDFESFFENRNAVIKLNKSSFPNTKLLNSDSLILYKKIKQKNKTKLNEFMPSYKNGWTFFINIPLFDDSKKKVVSLPKNRYE